jgi:hypothetical protein
MTALMYAGRMMGMQMDMPRMLGLMAAGPEKSGAVYLIGFMMHFMMGTVFGIIYAALFEAFGVSSYVLWGAVFGLAHGLIAGMAMAMMPAMHPRMGEGRVLSAPGPFAVNWGGMLPVGIIALHIVFGLTVGAIYG